MAYKKSTETRQRILDAAEILFRDKGYYETTIKDIAGKVEMLHSSIYYYFKNKEAIARAIFDIAAEKIVRACQRALEENPDQLTNVILSYILIFKYLALNKATQAVYYDMVRYADYDKANLQRLRDTFYYNLKNIMGKDGDPYSEKQVTAYILTSDAFAKALFKGIVNGILEFTIEEAIDFFCRHMLLNDIQISEDEYIRKFNEAFRMSEGLVFE